MNYPLETGPANPDNRRSDSRERSEAYPHALLGRALATISEGTLITDADQNVVYVNDAFTAITGYSQDEMLGANCRILQGPESEQATIDRLRDTLRAGEVFSGEILNFRKDQTSFWSALTITPVKNEVGDTTHFVSVQRDITLQKALTEQVHFLAHHDPATGLPNRHALELQLFEAVGRAQQGRGSLAVGIIDLDDFRAVNTSFDHEAGDQILNETARRLQGQLRKTDFVARIGGDKFAIIIENLDVEHVDHQIHATMNHLYRVVEEPYVLASGEDLSIGMSMGLAVFPRDAATVENLLRQADTALFEVKTAKNDRIQWWNTSTTLLSPAQNAIVQEHSSARPPENQSLAPTPTHLLSHVEQLVMELESTVAHLANNASMRIADAKIRSANQSAVDWIRDTLEDIIATSSGISLTTGLSNQ